MEPRGCTKTSGLARTWAGSLEEQTQGQARRGAAGTCIVGLSCVCFLPAPLHCPTPAGGGSGLGDLGKKDVNGTDGKDGRGGLLTANCPLWLRL